MQENRKEIIINHIVDDAVIPVRYYFKGDTVIEEKRLPTGVMSRCNVMELPEDCINPHFFIDEKFANILLRFIIDEYVEDEVFYYPVSVPMNLPLAERRFV